MPRWRRLIQRLELAIVGRAYAGVLGPLAFITMLARECTTTAATSTKLVHAWVALVLFAVLGSIIGWVAGRIIEDSARAQIFTELAAAEAEQTGSPS